MLQTNPIEPKSTWTIIRRVISGIIYVPQVFSIWYIGWIFFGKDGLESGMLLLILIPFLSVVTAFQIALSKGFMRVVHIGIVSFIAASLVYFFFFVN